MEPGEAGGEATALFEVFVPRSSSARPLLLWNCPSGAMSTGYCVALTPLLPQCSGQAQPHQRSLIDRSWEVEICPCSGRIQPFHSVCSRSRGTALDGEKDHQLFPQHPSGQEEKCPGAVSGQGTQNPRGTVPSEEQPCPRLLSLTSKGSWVNIGLEGRWKKCWDAQFLRQAGGAGTERWDRG